VSLALSATDADDRSITWTASGLPAGLSLTTASGLFYLTGSIVAGAANDGPVSAELTATGGTAVLDPADTAQ
jgi:hypothetical protein